MIKTFFRSISRILYTVYDEPLQKEENTMLTLTDALKARGIDTDAYHANARTLSRMDVSYLLRK